MTAVVSSMRQGNQLEITIVGRFDFSILQDFRNAYSIVDDDPVEHIIIDLSQSEHMDSSGMGLLLTLKKELNMAPGNIELKYCRPHIRDALFTARLDNYFKVN